MQLIIYQVAPTIFWPHIYTQHSFQSGDLTDILPSRKFIIAEATGIQMKIQSSLGFASLKVQTICLSQFKYSFTSSSLY